MFKINLFANVRMKQTKTEQCKIKIILPQIFFGTNFDVIESFYCFTRVASIEIGFKK